MSLGAVLGDLVYTVPIVTLEEHFSIAHWEMLNILVAIRVWGNQWKSQMILIKCDTQAVVSVLNSGKSSDTILSPIARNILFYCAEHDINLRLIHVLGKDNTVADILSRWYESNTRHNVLFNKIKNPIWCNVNRECPKIYWYI